MRIEQLDVVLRARSGWEAMELGTALVRRHARAIWAPCLLLGLPLFALVNALAWWADAFGLAWLLMWWLKPVFDRITLYVLSRGVFGDTPGTLQTLRAQRHWGGSGFWGYLGWRRFSPLRTLLLPANLLEGNPPAQQGARRRAIASDAFFHALLLTTVCMVFELVLVAGGIAAVFMFVPFELLSDSWRAALDMVREDTPAWALLGLNLAFWLAASLIGPFYTGAGFGLYLNRRTEMEAWDVEIAFRRLATRLQQAAPLLALVLVLGWPGGTLHAQEAAPHTAGAQAASELDALLGKDDAADDEADEDEVPLDHRNDPANTPEVIFADRSADTAGFRQAVQRAYEDPLQSPTRKVSRWQRTLDEALRKEKEKQDAASARGERSRAKGPLLPAQIAEWMLWGLVGILLVLLLVTAPRWLRWLRGSGGRRSAVAATVVEEAIVLPEVVPPDPAAQARTLWQQGRPRQALALLYRASVDSMSERAQINLPPGATEAQCLRASRRMPDPADRDLFARMVQVWQYAAYAGQLPSSEAFDTLAGTLLQQFRWRA
ncbi:DUF4129 domain-containing protein [Stenotrophomonas rhizophila]|uniref:DUF4129 domain-containing protein n=1 Tax=Stenotrophomonas rhizophila TaxID=216778 RepID=UPI001E2CF71A|nr:DUF4129 domain-containing protein [Stenotrophomonas rhizophila]MCC7634446.1 DUF4129 domain-containing protein [Stenotrophomonas rhizophila]MCC7663844.1 DUF4129 domain-containing protein [Stenotrophomonas rhizophila]